MKKIYKNEKGNKVTINADNITHEFKVVKTDDIANFPVNKATNRTELLNKGYVLFAQISECKCNCESKDKLSCKCNDY